MHLNKKEITLAVTALITFFSVAVGLVLANYFLIALVIPCIIATYKTLETITINEEVKLFYTKYPDIIMNSYNKIIEDNIISLHQQYDPEAFYHEMFHSVAFSTIEEGQEIKFHISEKAAKKIFEQLNRVHPISKKETITKEEVSDIPTRLEAAEGVKKMKNSFQRKLNTTYSKEGFVDRLSNPNRSSYPQRGGAVQEIS